MGVLERLGVKLKCRALTTVRTHTRVSVETISPFTTRRPLSLGTVESGRATEAWVDVSGAEAEGVNRWKWERAWVDRGQ
jgi:hypothetical protein